MVHNTSEDWVPGVALNRGNPPSHVSAAARIDTPRPGGRGPARRVEEGRGLVAESHIGNKRAKSSAHLAQKRAQETANAILDQVVGPEVNLTSPKGQRSGPQTRLGAGSSALPVQAWVATWGSGPG